MITKIETFETFKFLIKNDWYTDTLMIPVVSDDEMI